MPDFGSLADNAAIVDDGCRVREVVSFGHDQK
jgi:hypothetical protein